MRILLPPSETKRVGGDPPCGVSQLAFDAELSAARTKVRTALVQLSSGDRDAAAHVLGLGKTNHSELEYNLELDSSGILPAIERYTGVLYDMLDPESLDEAARAWLDEHVYVQSALFGLVSAADEIPAYRLSAGTRLPDLGQPLKRVWDEAHRSIEWPGLTLDLRSKDYAALAPVADAVPVRVAQRSDDGHVRALNHFNKAAKGDLVRRLAQSGADCVSIEGLLEWAREHSIEFQRDDELTLITSIGAPSSSTRR